MRASFDVKKSSVKKTAVKTYGVVVLIFLIIGAWLLPHRLDTKACRIDQIEMMAVEQSLLFTQMLTERIEDIRFRLSLQTQPSGSKVSDTLMQPIVAASTLSADCQITNTVGPATWLTAMMRACQSDSKAKRDLRNGQWQLIDLPEQSDLFLLMQVSDRQTADSQTTVLLLQPKLFLNQMQTLLGKENGISLEVDSDSPYGLQVWLEPDVQPVLAQWKRENWMIAGLLALLFLFLMRMAQRCVRIYEEKDKLEWLAITDALTGAYNRRYLMDIGHHEVKRSQRYGGSMSLLLIDADYFKDVNDRWGHGVGDQVLQTLSRTLVDSLRDSDVVARIGGEEFAVLLLQTTLGQARFLAERLAKTIRQMTVETSTGEQVAITVSIGVATLQPDETLDQLLSRADRSLYEAKGIGRDRVVLASD